MENITKAVILAALAGLAVGGSAPMLKVAVRKCDPLVSAAIMVTIATVTCWPYVLASGRLKYVMPAIKSGAYFWLLLGAGLLIGMVNLTLTLAYKYGEVTVVNTVQKPLSILFAIALGVVFLQESISIARAVGIVSVIGGIILVILG